MGDGPSHSTAPVDLAALFRRHGDGLAGAVRGVLGSRAECAEVLQDALLRALRFLDRNPAPADPVAWLFVVTLNTARDHRRRRLRSSRPVSLEDVETMELRADGPPPGAGLEQSEAMAAARTAIARLDDREKEVFLLRVSGGLTFEATADALGIPVGTAKTRMRSALARLRSSLAEHAPAARDRRTTR